MSILSQIGVVILIVFIVLVLIRSNKTLADVSKEGEHFVDEWALKEQKKEERKELKEEKKRELKSKKQKKLVIRQNLDDEEENEVWDEASEEEDNEIWYESAEKKNRESDESEYGERKYENMKFSGQPSKESEYEGAEYDNPVSGFTADNVIPMVKNKNTGIVLVEMDEQHYPVHRYVVDRIPYTIGRSKKNMLVLDDLCVARMHCRIVEKNGLYILKDSGTANKLFVNGETVSQTILSDKMRLYIGNVEFLIEMGMQRSDMTRMYQNAGAGYYE